VFEVQIRPWFLPDYAMPLDSAARNGFIQFTQLTVIISSGVEDFVQLICKSPDFIMKEPISDEIQVSEGSENHIVFTEEQLPKLCSVMTDLRYLVQQRVFLFFVTSKHNSEQRVIGQS
jgi:hypothetical protein